jgi:hypothetical protein
MSPVVYLHNAAVFFVCVVAAEPFSCGDVAMVGEGGTPPPFVVAMFSTVFSRRMKCCYDCNVFQWKSMQVSRGLKVAIVMKKAGTETQSWEISGRSGGCCFGVRPPEIPNQVR